MVKSFSLLILVFTFSSGLFAQSSLSVLKDKSDFDKFMGLPLSGKYGQVYSVKLLYDLENERLYFINSKFAKLHYRFCENYLDYKPSLAHFNEVNYSQSSERTFLLGNLNYIQNSGKYALELSSVDLMKEDDIIKLYNLVKAAFYAKNDFYFLANTARLQNLINSLQLHIPILNPTDIYGNLNYQAISKRSATGYLRFVSNLKTDTINENDIIVVDEVPLYLPKVAGVILTKFQTPLSHMAILGLNRRIPIIAYKTAFTDEKLKALSDEKVRFRVYTDSFKIYSVPKSNKYTPRYKVKELKYDLSVDSLIDTKDFPNDANYFVGNKAANFSKLLRLSENEVFKCPESSFAIPFSYYLNHVQSSQAQDLIEQVLFNKDIKENRDSLSYYLKRIRSTIKAYPISKNLINEVELKVKSLGSYTRMRFRSSTNAEDAYGFSGAGIYSSSTGILNNENKSFEKAIKKVWASLWSFEAFNEREIFHINHTQVFMGVLVHRSFPDEKANGVAITKNLYRRDSYGFVVNVQLGERSVVKPEFGVTCDQFVCYPNSSNLIYKNKNAIDIITKSSLNNGELVMSEDEIALLANQLKVIKNSFYYNDSHGLDFLEFGLGIEFKIVGEKRELYIKQARFYND